MTRKVHFILQGKGGVGKSFVAALLAQHYQANGRGAVVCVDTDPVNATFSGYGAFGLDPAVSSDRRNTSAMIT